MDLIRNDLTLISEPESVHVPNLFNVESYATVHQLVTTVKGKLKQELGSVDAVRYSFPPGSMTGAPKRRTVSILEDLEQIPRGAYSGALGFISVAGSAAEFNVVIRTAVITPQGKSVNTNEMSRNKLILNYPIPSNILLQRSRLERVVLSLSFQM